MATLLLIATAGAGCLGGEQGGGEEDADALVIGTILPLTGDLSVFGPDGEDAVRLAIDEINGAEGVNGKDVQLVTGDSATSQTDAPNEAARLINTEGVHALVGAYSSGVSLSFIDQVIQAKVPMISPANTAPTFTDYDDNGFYFRVAPSDALQARVMSRLAQEEGYTRAAIIAVNNDYGVGFGDVFQENFEANGGTVTAYEKYDPEATTFDTVVQEATADNPEVVILVAYPDTGSQVMQEAAQQGKTDSIDWLLSEGVFSGSFPGMVGEDDDGYIVSGMKGTTPQAFLDSEVDQNFAEKFNETYDKTPTLFAPGAYDAAVLFSLASEKCNCTDGEGIRDALPDVMNAPGTKVADPVDALEMVRNGEDIDYSGAAGDLDWDENGDTTTGVYAIYQFNEEGKIDIVLTDIRVNEDGSVDWPSQ